MVIAIVRLGRCMRPTYQTNPICEIASIAPNYVYRRDKPSGALAIGVGNTKYYEH